MADIVWGCKEKREFFPQTGGQKAYCPSVYTILEHLEVVMLIHFKDALILPDETLPMVLKVLDWLGFGLELYTKKINVIFLHAESGIGVWIDGVDQLLHIAVASRVCNKANGKQRMEFGASGFAIFLAHIIEAIMNSKGDAGEWLHDIGWHHPIHRLF